jgi:hypothetical protein
MASSLFETLDAYLKQERVKCKQVRHESSRAAVRPGGLQPVALLYIMQPPAHVHIDGPGAPTALLRGWLPHRVLLSPPYRTAHRIPWPAHPGVLPL